MKYFFITLFLATLTTGTSTIYAQKSKKSKKSKKEQIVSKKTPKKGEKTIKELTKKSEEIQGLFTIYRDTITGALKMLIKENQLEKEFIYFSQIRDGVLDARLFRGQYRKSKVFKIKKHFNKIELVTQNHAFYYDPKSNLSKSEGANISESILESLVIEASDKKEGLYLVNCSSLFLKETFSQVKPSKYPGQSPRSFQLGRLDKNKTKVANIKNYPQNTYVSSEYVYSNPSPSVFGSEAVTDSRNISIKVDHQLIAMPENKYKVRYDDPRVGYFMTKVTDMTTADPVPYRDLIHRWHLVKKDSTQILSEPKEPIVWWIENTTPEEFRPTIKEAVLEWNKAFEKAGFKNAIQVKIQPDDADWEAGDIRYNVLRWTASPNPPFGGYGPSFVNPRTGQILGADIMLEYIYHTNRVKYSRIFEAGAKQLRNFDLKCTYGDQMQLNTHLGHAFLKSVNSNDNELKGLTFQAMKELIMHEIGHTLGLSHNMKASQLFSPEELETPNLIQRKCLTGSVMDYSAINLTIEKEKQGPYYSTTVGPYDKWAIEYGYTPIKNDKELKQIANKSIQPELAFGNDADDMRQSGRGIDPRVMIGDLSNDQITFATDRLELIQKLFQGIKPKFEKEGQTYQEFTQTFYTLCSNYKHMGTIISRFVGGVYTDRSMIGQKEELEPYIPVSYSDQKRAMKALNSYFFSPNAWKVPSNLYNYLAKQRRGFDFRKGGSNEDPKIHDLVLKNQVLILNHLLHKNTLQRIIDSQLYGNKYSLSEFTDNLNSSIFDSDILSNDINSFRQNLQIVYTKRLITIITDSKNNYPNMVKSIALYNLKKIKEKVSISNGNTQTKAHKLYLKFIIENALEEL